MSHRTLTSTMAALVALLVVAPLGAAADPGPREPGPASPRAAGGLAEGWSVVPAADGWVATWTSPGPLPLTGATPVVVRDGVPVGTVTLTRDSVSVTTARRPDPRTLDVLLGERVLDRSDDPDAGLRGPVPAAAPPLDLGPAYDVDPGVAGPYATVTEEYDEGTLPFPGFPSPMEVRGHVVRPADGEVAGDRPLVLFLHGRHSVCYSPDGDGGGGWPCGPDELPIPSHLGYDYLQQTLASQGFVTVSIDANAINGLDYRSADGGADARSLLVRHHLDLWAGWAASDTYAVDTDNVVLVGHSRGGEGVNRAAQDLGSDPDITLTGLVYIAPTNFATQTASYLPAVTLLPGCDGDVSDLQGQSFVDVARDVTTDDTALKSSVLIPYANHNYFNTEWTPGLSEAPSWDDSYGEGVCGRGTPTRLTKREQQAAGTAYVGGAVWLMTGHEPDALSLFDGTLGHVASTGDNPARSHAVNGGRAMRALDGRGTSAATPTPAVDASARVCVAASGQGPAGCGGRSRLSSPSWASWPSPGQQLSRQLHLTWDQAGGSGGLAFGTPLDLAASPALDLRVITDVREGRSAVRVRVSDADGRSVEVDPLDGRRLDRFGATTDRRTAVGYAQTVRVPTAALTGIDPSRVTEVELVGASPTGGLFLLDVAAVPATLPPPPAQRIPTIEMGRLTVPEGDGGGTEQVDVPFTVHGTLTRPAVFAVTVMDPEAWLEQPEPQLVQLAPGDTGGTLAVTYESDTRDDVRLRSLLLDARPVSDVMPSSSLGELRIRDDDPTPTLTLEPAARTITEGERAAWVIRASAASDRYHSLQLRFVEAPGRDVAEVGDLNARWAMRHFGPVPPGRELGGYRTRIPTYLAAGRLTRRVRIPVRTDGVREGVEVLRAEVRGVYSSRGLGVIGTETIRVRDAR